MKLSKKVLIIFIIFFSKTLSAGVIWDSTPTLGGQFVLKYFKNFKGGSINDDDSNSGFWGYDQKNITEAQKVSYEMFTPEYRAVNSFDDFSKSFRNIDYLNVLEIFKVDGVLDPEETYFFLISVMLPSNELDGALWLGGESPKVTPQSEYLFWGTMTLTFVDGNYQINQLHFEPAVAPSGGHGPWQDSAESFSETAKDWFVEDGFTDDEKTNYVYPDQLAYTSFEDKATGDIFRIKTANVAGRWKNLGYQIIRSNKAGEISHFCKAKDYYHQKQFDKAIDEYNKQVELNPKDYEAFGDMGYAYYRNNQLKEAVDSLQQSVKINSHYVLGFYNLALVYWALGQKDDAIKQIQAALNEDPFCYEAIRVDPQFKEFYLEKKFKDLIP